MSNLRRMWINQPSTFQPFNNLHGTLGLVDLDGGDLEHLAMFYFLDGDTVGQQVHKSALSFGWPEKFREPVPDLPVPTTEKTEVFVATVNIALVPRVHGEPPITSPAEAQDAISGLFESVDKYVLDWGYLRLGSRYLYPEGQMVDLATYEEGDLV